MAFTMRLQLKDPSLKCHLHASFTTEKKFFITIIFHLHVTAGGSQEDGQSIISDICV